jgi:hypothetical protein
MVMRVDDGKFWLECRLASLGEPVGGWLGDSLRRHESGQAAGEGDTTRGHACLLEKTSACGFTHIV